MPQHGCLKNIHVFCRYILLHPSSPPRAGLGHPVLGVKEDKVVIETTTETRSDDLKKVQGLLPPGPPALASVSASASASAIPLELPGHGPVVMTVPSRIQHVGARVLRVCVYI